MNRRKFVASWSRKVFFGFCWPVMCFLGMAYFQSYSVPQSFLAWIYYILTHVGQFGLITSILYFILYLPVVMIFPSYYFSRIWVFTLVILINALLLIDIGVFFQYKLHLSKLILEFILDGDLGIIFGKSASGFILSFIFLLLMIAGLWFQGERTWKLMQARFSNPVKNWYLAFIVLGLILGQLIYNHAANNNNLAVTRLGAIFPLEWPVQVRNLMLGEKRLTGQAAITAKKDFKYNLDDLVCSAKSNRNIILIEIDHWRNSELDATVSPHLVHYERHGKNFAQHFSGGNDSKTGYISLMYSLPASYLKTVEENKIQPLFFGELKKRNYEMNLISLKRTNLNISYDNHFTPNGVTNIERNLSILDKWKEWTDSYSKTQNQKPFFAEIRFETLQSTDENDREFNQIPIEDLASVHQKAITQIDGVINKIITDLQQKGLVKSTVVFITGLSGIEFNDNLNNVWGVGQGFSLYQTNVPMIMLWPDKKFPSDKFLTSHYDFVPTLLRDIWGCKFKDKEVGYGMSLFNKDRKPNVLMSDANEFGILDFHQKQIITLNNNTYRVTDFQMNKISKSKVQKEIIFESLKDLSRMFKRQ